MANVVAHPATRTARCHASYRGYSLCQPSNNMAPSPFSSLPIRSDPLRVVTIPLDLPSMRLLLLRRRRRTAAFFFAVKVVTAVWHRMKYPFHSTHHNASQNAGRTFGDNDDVSNDVGGGVVTTVAWRCRITSRICLICLPATCGA